MNKRKLIIELLAGNIIIKLVIGQKETAPILVEGHVLTGSLLFEVDKILKKHKIEPGDLNQIVINSDSSSYTGQRIAFTVANFLALGLNIPVDIFSFAGVNQEDQKNQFNSPVFPKYSQKPHITKPKA